MIVQWSIAVLMSGWGNLFLAPEPGQKFCILDVEPHVTQMMCTTDPQQVATVEAVLALPGLVDYWMNPDRIPLAQDPETAFWDSDNNGQVNVIDLQRTVNAALGISDCTRRANLGCFEDYDSSGTPDVLDVQRLVFRILTGDNCSGTVGYLCNGKLNQATP